LSNARLYLVDHEGSRKKTEAIGEEEERMGELKKGRGQRVWEVKRRGAQSE